MFKIVLRILSESFEVREVCALALIFSRDDDESGCKVLKPN
jgi:hypothetical protein